jgi:outer membrane protein OmpA-like peptidoglycan-associated protein
VDPLVHHGAPGLAAANCAAPKPTTGQVAGLVTDSKTQKPLGGAMISFVGVDIPPVASEVPTGKFLTQDLPLGAQKMLVMRDGYHQNVVNVVIEAGAVTHVSAALEPMVKQARFEVTVSSKGKAVAAVVLMKGTVEKQLTVPESPTGPAALEVPGGHYTVEVTAPGFLAQTRDVQVVDGATMALSFELAPEPQRRLVIVRNDKIEILQQVHFEQAKAVIQEDSFPLLSQVVDAIIKHNIKRVRVEGHTDNRGSKSANQKLSQDRAQAVADFFAKSGIDPSRLEVHGYGDERPIAPNLTAKGRQLNRRVEFVILER